MTVSQLEGAVRTLRHRALARLRKKNERTGELSLFERRPAPGRRRMMQDSRRQRAEERPQGARAWMTSRPTGPQAPRASAWTERFAAHRQPRFVIPGFARAFAVAALVVFVALTTTRAAADNPLYGARVAIEDSLLAFQSDPVGYLSQVFLHRAARGSSPI